MGWEVQDDARKAARRDCKSASKGEGSKTDSQGKTAQICLWRQNQGCSLRIWGSALHRLVMAQPGDYPEEFIAGWKSEIAEWGGGGYDGNMASGNSLNCGMFKVRCDAFISHAVRDPNGRAYNRTSHLAERWKMMQSWADNLEG